MKPCRILSTVSSYIIFRSKMTWVCKRDGEMDGTYSCKYSCPRCDLAYLTECSPYCSQGADKLSFSLSSNLYPGLNRHHRLFLVTFLSEKNLHQASSRFSSTKTPKQEDMAGEYLCSYLKLVITLGMSLM